MLLVEDRFSTNSVSETVGNERLSSWNLCSGIND